MRSAAATEALQDARAAVWARACELVRAGVERVRAYPAALSEALAGVFSGTGSAGTKGPSVLVPPLQDLVCDYVLWP